LIYVNNRRAECSASTGCPVEETMTYLSVRKEITASSSMAVYYRKSFTQSFGKMFSLVYFRSKRLFTSELLRFHYRVAASKPTSWLSFADYFLLCT